MAGRDEFRRPSEQDGGEQDGGELRRVPPGRRTLTQTIGGAPGAGATASPGKISLERGFISQAMVSSWKGLSEEMIQLDAFQKVPAADKAKIQKREGEVRGAAVGHANTLYAELAAATTNERTSTPSKIEGEEDRWNNPYTGARLKEHKGKALGDGAYEASTFSETAPGDSAQLGALLARGEDPTAARLWGELQSGVERWAQTRLERGRDDLVPGLDGAAGEGQVQAQRRAGDHHAPARGRTARRARGQAQGDGQELGRRAL